jgi:flagellar biosynthesis protein FlhF
MTLRRFTAPTAAAAFRAAKAALGAEAVILETQPAPGGVTVVAATDVDEARSHAELLAEVRALLGAVQDLVAARTAAPPAPEAVVELAHRLSAMAPARAEARLRLFVGPPGDGKTTTVAKLAARERAAGREVVLVAADTWRVGARAELEAYGRALGVRVARVREAGDLAAVARAAPDSARVLVDTAGAGPGDAAVLADVAALAAAAGPGAGVTLVTSATSAPAAVARVCRAFAALAPDACVLTKVDAGAAAPLLELLCRERLPVTHLATGRRIPDDLEAATPERLARATPAS